MIRYAAGKVYAVAAREYLATVRTRAFLVALFLMPLLSGGALALPVLFERHGTAEDRRVALIDYTATLVAAIEDAARARNASLGDEFLVEDRGKYFLERVEPPTAADRERVLYSLSERVRKGELFAFAEIDASVIDSDPEVGLRYFSNTPTQVNLRSWLEHTIETLAYRVRLQRIGVDAELVISADRRVRVLEESLLERQGAKFVVPDAPNPVRDIGIPFAAAMLMFTSVMLGVGPLMQSALEEKMQRIAEVLVSSVPPFQLLLGKLLGASAVSYTLLALYGGGGLLVTHQFGVGLSDQWSTWLLIIAFQAVALPMYGSVFLAVGSACNDLKESQSLMMPVMIVVTAPLLLLRIVLLDPNSTAATIASFFPPFTPILMMLRCALPPGAPWWHGVLGGVLSAGFAWLCLLAAGRVFRVGMLMQGGAPSYRTLWRWIRHG